MSIGLLTSLLIVGTAAAQNKSAELPNRPYQITCTAHEDAKPATRTPATVLIDNEGNIIPENKVTAQTVILVPIQFYPDRPLNYSEVTQPLSPSELRQAEKNLAKLNIFEKNATCTATPPVENTTCPGETAATSEQASSREPARVGQIIIVGNTATPQDIILQQIPFYSGQELNLADLRAAEENLVKTGFLVDPERNIRPTVKVLDPENDEPHKDILVTVEESCLTVFLFGPDKEAGPNDAEPEGEADDPVKVRVLDPESDDPVKDIHVTVQETHTGSLMLKVGVSSDAGLTGSITLAHEPEVLEVMPQEESEPGVMMSPCPYLKAQANQAVVVEPCITATVFDKLAELEEAREAFRLAERCRKTGDLEAATAWYQQAQQVCPGSPLHPKIAARLKEIADQQVALREPATDTEEAETGAVYRIELLPCRKAEPIEARVAELVEACQRAIGESNYEKARSLVYQAMLLDPACIAVKAMVEKLQEMDQSKQPVEEPAEEPTESAPVDPITAPEDTLQPPLPPVDPGIVDALEKVLRQTGEPTTPKLVIGVDEPQEDEVEEPVSQWRPGATSVEIPSLVDPEGEDESLQDPSTSDENPSDEPELKKDELEQLLREACGAILQGNYVDVGEQPTEGQYYTLSMRVGGIQCRLTVDDWGHRYLILQLLPEASGDLRLMQEAHNQRVLNWIVGLNSGGNQETGAEEPADYDHEDLERLREDIEDPEPEEEAIN